MSEATKDVRAALADLRKVMKTPRRRPPKGWTIVKVFIAYAPDDWEETRGITCAGDGGTFRTHKEAVDAAWNEHESDEKRQAAKGRRRTR